MEDWKLSSQWRPTLSIPVLLKNTVAFPKLSLSVCPGVFPVMGPYVLNKNYKKTTYRTKYLKVSFPKAEQQLDKND